MLWPSKSRPGGSVLVPKVELGPVPGSGVAAGQVRGVGVAAGPVPGLGVALTEAPFGIPFGIAKVITPPFQAIFKDSACAQGGSSKALEVPTALGSCPDPPMLPATPNSLALGQVSGGHSSRVVYP